MNKIQKKIKAFDFSTSVVQVKKNIDWVILKPTETDEKKLLKTIRNWI